VLKIIPPSSESWKLFRAASRPAARPSLSAVSIPGIGSRGAGGGNVDADAVDVDVDMDVVVDVEVVEVDVAAVGADLGILGGGSRRDPSEVVTVTLGLGTGMGAVGAAGSVEREASCDPLKRTRLPDFAFPAVPVLGLVGAQVVDSPTFTWVLEENEEVSKVLCVEEVPMAPAWSRRQEERAPRSTSSFMIASFS
jgi:hypothetical protein